MTKIWFRVLPVLALLASFHTGFAAADESPFPLQPNSPRPRGPRLPVEVGSTAQMERDWNSVAARQATAPDHSYRTLWVRMFPLVSVPLSDPFPQTVDVNNINLHNGNGFDVYDLATLKPLGHAIDLHFDFRQPTFFLGNANLPLSPLWIVPSGTALSELTWDKGNKEADGTTASAGIRVRGGLVIMQTLHDEDDLGKPKWTPQVLWTVINVVDVEHYLQAVVPSEAVTSWHASTLRAQAIAARTFGLHEAALARAAGRPWDVDPTTWFQSYRGAEFLGRDGAWRPVELPVTTAAVNATRGQTVTYHGEVIEAYFSGNSGGKTCTVNECFGLPDLPYIKQIPDAKGILQAPGGTWGTAANITPATITSILQANAITPTAPVVRLEALRTGPSGRIWQLRVILKTGALELDPLQTRKVMKTFGPIRSFLYNLGNSDKKGKQAVVGHGYGHGVGMSQYGAELFARQGWSAARILNYYYPGTQIKVLAPTVERD